MNSVVFGFHGEGIRDYTFTKRIVERTMQGLLPHSDVQSIEIRVEGRNSADKLVAIARETWGYHLAIVHMDADSPSVNRALNDRFDPGYQIVLNTADVNKDILPIIPVRNTEAWMLVDFEAFKEVVGTKKLPSELGFPNKPQLVESIEDPKTVFEYAIKYARDGIRHYRPPTPDEVYYPLASALRLSELQKVDAYGNVFRNRLIQTLKALHLIMD